MSLVTSAWHILNYIHPLRPRTIITSRVCRGPVRCQHSLLGGPIGLGGRPALVQIYRTVFRRAAPAATRANVTACRRGGGGPVRRLLFAVARNGSHGGCVHYALKLGARTTSETDSLQRTRPRPLGSLHHPTDHQNGYHHLLRILVLLVVLVIILVVVLVRFYSQLRVLLHPYRQRF